MGWTLLGIILKITGNLKSCDPGVKWERKSMRECESGTRSGTAGELPPAQGSIKCHGEGFIDRENKWVGLC